jgi:hypothetical protein
MSPKALLAILIVLGLSMSWLYRYEIALYLGKTLLYQALSH